MDKTALIVAGGDRPQKSQIKEYIKKVDFIIAADKGGDYLKSLKIIPDALVGDFDSIDKKSIAWFEKRKVNIHITNAQKDETDTMLCVMLAKGMGATRIVILGGLGGRIDHQIANIALLIYAKSKGIDAVLIDEKNSLFLIDANYKSDISISENFSIFAVSDKVEFNYSHGLKYKLDGLVIEKSNPIGVSNMVSSNEVEVDIKNGLALVVVSKE